MKDSPAPTPLRAFILVAAAVALAGCNSMPPLRVATSGDYPPFSVSKPYGAIVGFDTDVAAQFTRDSRREMYFVPLRWPRLIQQAEAHEFDVAMSGITMRGDRVPYLLFSRPYAVTGAVVAVRVERQAEFPTLEQVDRPGIRLAVNRGGHLERVARQRFRQAQVLTVEDNRTLADRVLRGEVDAAVSDALEVGAWPVEAFAIIGPFTRDRKAYAVTPDQSRLLAELNEWLAAREEDGWLNGERRRWLSSAAVWTVDDACFESIAAAIDLRMLLMPKVAAAKSRLNLPIEDPVQEQNVLTQAADWAAAEGIDPIGVIALFEQLIEIAKRIQRRANLGDTILLDVDLEGLRSAIRFYSHSLVRELGRCQRSLRSTDAEARLTRSIRAGEAFADSGDELIADLASVLANPPRVAPTPRPSAATEVPVPAAGPSAPLSPPGTYVEFCIPPNLRFDREGYGVEEIGVPGAASRELLSGRTRIAVEPGRHAYRFWVNGSSGDPRLQDENVSPASVAVEIPRDQVVTVRLTPQFSTAGEFELRWQDVYGAAVGGLEMYRGLTRFEVEVLVSEPVSTQGSSPCPW